MVKISVINGDIMSRPCDVLILKHADGFYGVDKEVSQKIGFVADVPDGSHAFTRGNGIEARKILYVGVGNLRDFRYEKIREFAAKSLTILSNGTGSSSRICSPVHGPGYGLDDKEAFLSLISGFYDALEANTAPKDLDIIDIVEQNSTRAKHLRQILAEFQDSATHADRIFTHNTGFRDENGDFSPDQKKRSSFGSKSERKKKLFVAMPFAEQYSDIWEIAVQEACNKAGIVCERIAEQSYTGDVVQEIRKRVTESVGLIVVLNDANPNVFLELGYAWALHKPTVLIMRAREQIPFDARGQKCLFYRNISELRTMLTNELNNLNRQGVFDPKN